MLWSLSGFYICIRVRPWKLAPFVACLNCTGSFHKKNNVKCILTIWIQLRIEYSCLPKINHLFDLFSIVKKQISFWKSSKFLAKMCHIFGIPQLQPSIKLFVIDNMKKTFDTLVEWIVSFAMSAWLLKLIYKNVFYIRNSDGQLFSLLCYNILCYTFYYPKFKNENREKVIWKIATLLLVNKLKK